MVAVAFHHGTRVPLDLNLAVELYTISAELGDGHSQLLLGDTYLNGELGQGIDLEKAKHYYYLASKNGRHTKAIKALGNLVPFDDPIGTLTEKLQWYRRALSSKGGFPQLQMGKLFLHGYLPSQISNVELGYFHTSSDHGNAEAAYWLGRIYEYGSGVEVNMNTAVRNYKLAAIRGLPIAYVKLGRMYERGRLVNRNTDIAIAFYNYAYRNFDSQQALAALRRLNAVDIQPNINIQAILQQ
jgi:TPR repeat protein